MKKERAGATGSHVTAPVNYAISGALAGLWFEWAMLVDSNIICHQEPHGPLCICMLFNVEVFLLVCIYFLDQSTEI